MAREPLVSVVVATYGRAHLLPALLDGLAKQAEDIGADRMEVVIVEDASPDDTTSVLARLASSVPFRLVALRQDVNAGPAAARNRGWRTATADVVAFTDDDCVPQPGWLAALTAAIADGADLAQGRTDPDPVHFPEHGPFGRTMRVPREEGFYETCNIAYRRSWLERLEGLDESYRLPYGEDTDLAWRALEAGASSAFVPDAVVHHAVFPSDWRAAWRDVRRCEGLHRTLHRHPALRGRLGKRVFHRPAHAAALAAAAGGVALLARPTSVPRWLLAGALGARYGWVVRQSRFPPPTRAGWIGVVPAAFVLDLYETWMYARASVRERALLL